MFLIVAIVTFAADVSAQTTLVAKGKATAKISVNGNIRKDVEAAKILQRFVKESSGAELPIVFEGKSKGKGNVIIGTLTQPQNLTADSYRIFTDENGNLNITGVDNGTIYGIVGLLEDNLGMNYLAADTYKINKKRDIIIASIDTTVTPAFRYRQSQAYGMARDSVYRYFLRLKEPGDMFVDRLWVHTFDRLLPSAVYSKEHPEYYSFISGERRPGSASQLCLTNPDVLELVAQRMDSIFKANPEQNMISVSQNDGNFTYCHCEECEMINEAEGSPSGNYIRFVNKLAERFPDKEISTLAYLFTMHPPKITKPLRNVNIMLCDIDCEREVPLTDNASGREFVEALEGWSALTDNIFVWDYGINFNNMIAPFPNFPILKPNIELFKKNGVNMHFSQIGSPYGGDFSEMRSWIVSKLMWNPDQDVDELMLRFMNDYYGDAAPYLYQYEKLLEGSLMASGQRLWIYDSPVSHKNGMLNATCRKKYGQLFDKAETAVADDPELLRRVRMARLPLLFSNLEINRTLQEKDLAAVEADLDTFEKYINEFGIRSLDENNTSASKYCELYRTRYLNIDPENMARGAIVEWIIAPSTTYKELGERTLTDGLYGGTSYADSWTGWEGTDGSFIIDLSDEKEFSSVSTDFLHQLGSWILFPRSVNYFISSDKTSWKPFGEQISFPEDRTRPVKFVQATATEPDPVKARYVKVDIEGTKICPSWHFGVGCPSWFFADEVIVK